MFSWSNIDGLNLEEDEYLHALWLVNRVNGKIAKTIRIFLEECFLISGFDENGRRNSTLQVMVVSSAQINVGARDV